MDEKRKKIIGTILGVLLFASLIIGLTYAWFVVRSEDVNIKSTNKDFEIIYNNDNNAGSDISGTLFPAKSKEDGLSTYVTIKRGQNSLAGDIKLILEIENLTLGGICSDVSYKSESECENNNNIWTKATPDKIRYEIVSENKKVSAGNFANAKTGDKVVIAESIYLPTEEARYDIYIWLDYSAENEYIGTSLEGVIKVEATQREFVANSPDIIDGMIPIRYDENLSTWVKAKEGNEENNWYDYANKKWANVALVSSISTTNTKLSDGSLCTGEGGFCTREDYMNASVDIEIPEADILAYYVWIPRYKYQLFNVEFAAIDPIEIQVIFEYEKATTGIPSDVPVNGEWLTHPAFTFGDDELTGLWVAKFEVSGSSTAPKIKPLVSPYLNQTHYTFFTTAQNFGNDVYLTETGVDEADSHMIKNIEWGAMAYLKQSKYGLGTTDIALNNYLNSSAYRTGCGSAVGATGTTTSCSETTNGYKTANGMNASTTGNVYGIYDVAGGAVESVMATIETKTSGSLSYGSSGFNATSLPYGSKYVDMYAYGETGKDQAAYNRSHLGDALGETRGWYSDTNAFAYNDNMWVDRGGASGKGIEAGIYYFGRTTGVAGASRSFRSVITKIGS